MGAGPEPKPDKEMVPFQWEEIHRNYLLAHSSYEAEGPSENLPRLHNYVAGNNMPANIGNLLYGTLNERLGKTLDDTFNDKRDNDGIKKTTIAILAMIALKGSVEYKEFDKFGSACFSLGLLRENFDFEALEFRATNSNIHYALHGLLKGGYVAQGQIGEVQPTLVATQKLDWYLQ
tara:strand:- start:435 stop:962 length:528 start_codon:yes stop_codon:yes gene_type:complete